MVQGNNSTNGTESFFWGRRYSLSGWLGSSVCLSSLALYSALVVPSLPNCSLLLYGFAAICAWHTLPLFDCRSAGWLSLPHRIRRLTGWGIILWSCLFCYVGIVSAVSTFAFFPHPNILGRFWNDNIPLHLPTLVYVPALVIGYMVGARGYRLLRGPASEKLAEFARNQERRERLLSWWISTADQVSVAKLTDRDVWDRLKNGGNVKVFGIYIPLFWRRRIVSIWPLLLAIPVWIFIGIPLRSYPSLSAIPLAYRIGMGTTGVCVAIWLAIVVGRSLSGYHLNREGVIQKGPFRESGILWRQIQGAFLYEGILYLEDLKGKGWKFFLQDLREPSSLWQETLLYLPLEILLIADNGWRYLQKILLPANLDDFVAKYHKVWTEQDENKKGEKKKGKKKGKKKSRLM